VQNTTKIASKLRSLELCVGAGGLALGLARAGFEHAGVIELDDLSCETLRYNKRNNVKYVRDWKIVQDDISGLDFSKYAGLDLLSGGPPCQPFSQGGHRNGRSDRREMFPQFIRATRECAPRSFIIENVKGLLDRPFINYFNYLIHQLRFPEVQRKKGEKWIEHRARLERLYTSGTYSGLHYNVISQVLNAANFGVAQRRDRVFIVGVRADLGIEYSFPLPTHSRESLWFEQWVNGKYWDRHRIGKNRRPEVPGVVKSKLSLLDQERNTMAWKTVRDAISDLPNVGLGRTSHIVLNHFFNPGARTYKGHGGSDLDAPAKTIKAGHNGVPGGENMIRLDEGAVRYFSVRECARLQAFPDDWFFDGSWCACMRQVGNAVPVTLGEVVAAPLATALLSRSD
jgi:DNA (cytosine-5)-methyltransferase 1